MSERRDVVPALAPEIRAHYDLGGEAERLTRGKGLLELERTRSILLRHLPPALTSRGATRVLDVGGATGVHAFWLAELGYDVELVDPVESQVATARRMSAERATGRLRGVRVGDARALDARDASFDAVLLLGPMYHLVEAADRQAALVEARRVVRPGGVVVAATISRFASTFDGLARRLIDDPAFVEITERDRATGRHLNPTGEPRYFTTAYFHHPLEIGAELRAAGLVDVVTLGVEGPAWMLQDLEQQWSDPVRRERMLAALAAIESEPTLLGASAHLLSIGRRPG